MWIHQCYKFNQHHNNIFFLYLGGNLPHIYLLIIILKQFLIAPRAYNCLVALYVLNLSFNSPWNFYNLHFVWITFILIKSSSKSSCGFIILAFLASWINFPTFELAHLMQSEFSFSHFFFLLLLKQHPTSILLTRDASFLKMQSNLASSYDSDSLNHIFYESNPYFVKSDNWMILHLMTIFLLNFAAGFFQLTLRD